MVVRVYSDGLEEYVLAIPVITRKHFPPIHYRVLCYSRRVLSSLRENRDELIAFCLIECVYLVNQHKPMEG